MGGERWEEEEWLLGWVKLLSLAACLDIQSISLLLACNTSSLVYRTRSFSHTSLLHPHSREVPPLHLHRPIFSIYILCIYIHTTSTILASSICLRLCGLVRPDRAFS